jgi:CheY-like chemotaxis protein
MAAVAVLPAKVVEQQHDVAVMDVDMHQTATTSEEDLYTRLKTLQRQLEFLEIQVWMICSSPAVRQQQLRCLCWCSGYRQLLLPELPLSSPQLAFLVCMCDTFAKSSACSM